MKQPQNRMQTDRATRAKNKPPAQEDSTAFHVSEKQSINLIAVYHKPAQCPNCGSARSEVVKVVHPTETVTKRIHRCLNDTCKKQFTSVQEVPAVDVGKPSSMARRGVNGQN